MVADKFPNGLIGLIGPNPTGPIGPIGPIVLRIPPQLARNICCQKGAECYTRQKCHRWVVLCVRPIVAIFC